MRGALLTIAACLALVFAGCGDDDSSTTTSGGDETSAAKQADPSKQAESTKEKTKPEVTVPKGAPPKKLVTKDLEVGTGATAKAGDEVTVHYVGVGYDTKQQFDASWDRGEPITFPLGAGRVIAGWDQGVAGMKVGGRRELVIPSELGYGAAGYPPAIGQNEALIFVVDLEAVK